MNDKKIVVIGSINIDMVTKSIKFPQKGETIIGQNFGTFFGGKGANQAVCASRLGANVSFIGCVGDDINGVSAIKNLADNEVNISGINKIEGLSTGVAQITIAENDNSIIIVKGANDLVTKEVVNNNIEFIKKADIVLMQLEIPLETVEYVLEICNKEDIITVLNPAPAMKLSSNILGKVDYLTPNETEFNYIFDEQYRECLKKNPNKLIVTKGSNGVDFCDGTNIINVPAHKVEVVDTTGAGDSFNAALCVGLVKGMSLSEAIMFGNKVASKTIQKLGAQTSMPYIDELL